jgi:hypothetical protein
MAKRKQPADVILPPELDDDDEDTPGGGIPDDDGWIHLEGQANGPIVRDIPPEERQRPVARRNARRRRQ